MTTTMPSKKALSTQNENHRLLSTGPIRLWERFEETSRIERKLVENTIERESLGTKAYYNNIMSGFGIPVVSLVGIVTGFCLIVFIIIPLLDEYFTNGPSWVSGIANRIGLVHKTKFLPGLEVAERRQVLEHMFLKWVRKKYGRLLVGSVHGTFFCI